MFDIRQSRLQLWAIAQHFLGVLFDLFGAPEVIAARHTLRRSEWAMLAKWLRAGEAMMRQLLLVEASHCAKPNTPPLLRKQRARARKLVGFDADTPENWRVCLRLSLPGRSAKREEPGSIGQQAASDEWTPDRRVLTHAGPGNGGISREDRWCAEKVRREIFHSAWPLAERAEALLRVFNDPLPFARRLARKLYARPHQARALLRYPREAPDLVGEPELAEVLVSAGLSLRAFRGSG
jgi:hypothetical protein